MIADLIMYIKIPYQRREEYGEIDYGATIKSERLIKQLKDFESGDTKKYDLVMAFGYTLMAHEIYLALLQKPVDTGYQASEINAVLNALSKVH